VSSELDYAAVYLESRFPMNSKQRLALREAPSEPAPLFVLVRTRLGCIWRFREDLLGATIGNLSKLAGREGPLSSPLEAAPPPERAEPMARVLREVDPQVEVTRDLLMVRAGWAATGTRAPILFRVEAEDFVELEGASKLTEKAQMGSSPWRLRGAWAQLDASEWIRFADLIRFSAPVPAAP
jgi:hypothetical protein